MLALSPFCTVNNTSVSGACYFFVIDRYKFDSYSLIKEGTDFMPSLVIQMTKNLFSLQRLGFIYFSSIFFFTRHFRSQGIKGRMFWVYRLVIEQRSISTEEIPLITRHWTLSQLRPLYVGSTLWYNFISIHHAFLWVWNLVPMDHTAIFAFFLILFF